MKKIIIFTLCIIFIPFFIVLIYKLYFLKEIELNYIESRNIRVKRNASGVIVVMPLEEYIVGVLAGEMPIYFDSEALKAQAVASRSYAMKRIGYNKDNDYDVVDSVMNQVYLDNDYLKKAWGINYKENINKLRSAVNETLDEVMYYDNDIFDNMKRITFENIEVFALNKRNDFLEIQYGDYMKLPPESEQTWYHHPIYISFDNEYTEGQNKNE